MILNSRSYYSHEQLAFADFCRVLALPARVAVLEEVALKKTCCEEELIEIGGMAPSTIREHLKELKRAGLIKGSLTRHNLHYCIDWDRLEEFRKLFDMIYKEVKRHGQLVTKHNGRCISKD